MIKTPRRTCFAIVLAGCVGWGATANAAQPPTRNASADGVETSGMRCWWETGKRAVRVGEPFGLVLTCRVMETDRVKVVPTLTELEPTSIELTPFEVLEGSRHEDIVVAPWRYLQYQYTVRLLGDEFFGRDVPIPATNVTFRIQTEGAETVEGTEHRYVLPPMPIRILSLLPAQAADIRDPTVDTFGDLEARRSRATIELVAAAIFFGFAAIPAFVAVLRVSERFRTRGPVVEPTVAPRTVLDACVREIESARADALRDGWTSALAGRALAPFRVAGAIALKQPVAQTMVSGEVPSREGQVAIRHGLLHRRRALVSASITAETMDRLRAAGNGTAPRDSSLEVLDPIRAALAALNTVRYARDGRADVQALDRTLEDGCRALRRLRRARWWPARAAAALPKPAALSGSGAWSR